MINKPTIETVEEFFTAEYPRGSVRFGSTYTFPCKWFAEGYRYRVRFGDAINFFKTRDEAERHVAKVTR